MKASYGVVVGTLCLEAVVSDFDTHLVPDDAGLVSS